MELAIILAYYDKLTSINNVRTYWETVPTREDIQIAKELTKRKFHLTEKYKKNINDLCLVWDATKVADGKMNYFMLSAYVNLLAQEGSNFKQSRMLQATTIHTIKTIRTIKRDKNMKSLVNKIYFNLIMETMNKVALSNPQLNMFVNAIKYREHGFSPLTRSIIDEFLNRLMDNVIHVPANKNIMYDIYGDNDFKITYAQLFDAIPIDGYDLVNHVNDFVDNLYDSSVDLVFDFQSRERHQRASAQIENILAFFMPNIISNPLTIDVQSKQLLDWWCVLNIATGSCMKFAHSFYPLSIKCYRLMIDAVCRSIGSITDVAMLDSYKTPIGEMFVNWMDNLVNIRDQHKIITDAFANNRCSTICSRIITLFDDIESENRTRILTCAAIRLVQLNRRNYTEKLTEFCEILRISAKTTIDNPTLMMDDIDKAILTLQQQQQTGYPVISDYPFMTDVKFEEACFTLNSANEIQSNTAFAIISGLQWHYTVPGSACVQIDKDEVNDFQTAAVCYTCALIARDNKQS